MMDLINQLRTKIWTQVFAIYLRYLIGGAFTYASVVKIMSHRFTSMSGENSPINTPFHFFETLYQAGLYWQFLGWSQLVAAFLLMTQRFAKLGALIFFPIILNIFVITISINFNYTFIITGLMLLANVFLLIWHIDELKFLINLKSNFEFKIRFENKKIWEITGFILFIITLCFRIFIIKYDLILWVLLCISVGTISLFIGLRKNLTKNKITDSMKMTLLTALLFCATTLLAQKSDTIHITPENINTKALREGVSRYLVYFKMNKDSIRTQTQFWTRTIKRTDYKGASAIEITQVWEDKDSIMHIVESLSDAKTMQPLYHKTWWKVQATRNATVKTVSETSVDFLNKAVNYNGSLLSNADTSKQAMAIWNGYKSSVDKYFLNWHLDLETFPLLPYKKGVTFVIPFYDPGTSSKYQQVVYTVIGSAELTGYNEQKIDCWLLVHESKGNKEVFWISKKTKEVLKLEQEINGRIYRYKIKLGFSI